MWRPIQKNLDNKVLAGCSCAWQKIESNNNTPNKNP